MLLFIIILTFINNINTFLLLSKGLVIFWHLHCLFYHYNKSLEKYKGKKCNLDPLQLDITYINSFQIINYVHFIVYKEYTYIVG